MSPPPLTRSRRLVLLDALRHTTSFGGLGPASKKPLTSSAVATWLVAQSHAPDDASALELAASLGFSSAAGAHAGAVAAAAGPKPAVLNSLDAAHCAPRPLEDVLRDLSRAFAGVCGAVLSRDGHEVLYAEVGRQEAWGTFLVAVDDLRAAVVGEMDEGVKKAGLFNLYNGLIIHAKLVYGHPTSLAKRGTFFNSAAYTVCGTRLASGDLEHQVLRCKASDESPLAPLRLAARDARMHFVLNCGARSCPPIRPIGCDTAETDIQASTLYFINLHVQVDGTKVTLSRLWKWFRNDFTPNTTRTPALLAWISGNGPQNVRDMLLPLVSAMKNDGTLDGGETEGEDTKSHDGGRVSQTLSPRSSKRVRIKFQRYDWADNGNWGAPRDDSFMHIYDASFALNK